MLFELNQKVAIKVSGEQGVVTGRAEYTDCNRLYRLHYKSADGRAMMEWWTEDALEPLIAAG